MRSRLSSVLLVAFVALAACNDADDDIRANVTILVNHEGALATAAAEHLSRYGRRAIPTIEAAMHTANGPGRKNLIMALRKIGDAEAVPLLGHIAVYDPSPDVQREAVWTLKTWAADARYPDRAARAKQALRDADEAKKAEEQG